MLAALSILFLLGLSAFGDAGQANLLTTRALKDLSSANYKFSIDLYKRLVKPTENLITSGISVSTVLSMLFSGSGGRTQNELLSVLGYNNLTREDLHGAYPHIIKALRGNGSYELSLANSMWLEQSFRALGSYQNVMQNSYDAEVRQLNLPTGKVDINEWVKTKTYGMIPQLLESELSTDTVMVLLNAIFFKGKWAQPFDNKTFEGGFLNQDIYIADAPTGTTEMMSTKGWFNYTDSKELKAQLLDIPYEGGDVSMIIVLPHWKLADVEADLTSYRLQNAINQMSTRLVSIVMPVFNIESSLDLNTPLQAMGAQEMFTNHANLTRISASQRLTVSKVFQKAKIEVGVEGTKAAAVTGVIVETFSIPIYKEFRATRPFLFLLRHKPTNTILFSGRYIEAEPYRK